MPELKEIQISAEFKQHIISFMFLYKYGGIFISTESQLVTNDLAIVVDQLKKYEFVGFDCSSLKTVFCKMPSSLKMASRPKRILMENVIKRMISASNKREFNYSFVNISDTILVEEIQKLVEVFNYEYYHFI